MCQINYVACQIYCSLHTYKDLFLLAVLLDPHTQVHKRYTSCSMIVDSQSSAGDAEAYTGGQRHFHIKNFHTEERVHIKAHTAVMGACVCVSVSMFSQVRCKSVL